MSPSDCPICDKHRGRGPLVGPVIYRDDLVHISHRATGSFGYTFIETARHVPHLDQLTEQEAQAVGRARSRLARALRAELATDYVHAMVVGAGVAHFHEHVFVRHRGTPEHYAWHEQWPDAPRGDIPQFARCLAHHLT